MAMATMSKVVFSLLGAADLASGLVQPNASALAAAVAELNSTRVPSRSLSASATVPTDLLMCDCNGQNCKERYWELPGNEWASACDTLGDLGGSAEVCKFKFTASTSATVKLAFFTDEYCTGDAVESRYAWQGRFNANDHGGWYKLQVPAKVRSIRPTVVIDGSTNLLAASTGGSEAEAARDGVATQVVSAVELGSGGVSMVGVKMVMWPLYNQDAQIGTADEFDCAQGNPGVNVNVNGGGWPQACVSPVDRVWCVAVNAQANSVEDWGALDHLGSLDFADNLQQAAAFDGDSGSGYPMGSVMMNKYTSSWTGHAACSASPHARPPAGKCVVTKLYGMRCNELTGCDSNCNLNAWNSGKELYTLREGQRMNSGGASGPWPARIRCAWTRVVAC